MLLFYGNIEGEVCQMSEITKITKQKRSSDRYNIYLDNTYAFSVSEDIFVKFQLHKGKHLSPSILNKIKRADDFHRSYIQAIHYLSYRMRSEMEVRDYLKKKEIVDETIDAIIEKLYDEKLLDDLQFASMFITDRINHSNKGPIVIQKELLGKGVSQNKIDQALQQFSETKQLQKIRKWLEKEVNKKSKYPFHRRKEQLTKKLFQRGFTQAVIDEALQGVEMEKDEAEEMELLKKQADKLYNKYKKKFSGYELQMRMKQRLYQQGFEMEYIQQYLNEIER